MHFCKSDCLLFHQENIWYNVAQLNLLSCFTLLKQYFMFRTTLLFLFIWLKNKIMLTLQIWSDHALTTLLNKMWKISNILDIFLCRFQLFFCSNVSMEIFICDLKCYQHKTSVRSFKKCDKKCCLYLHFMSGVLTSDPITICRKKRNEICHKG